MHSRLRIPVPRTGKLAKFASAGRQVILFVLFAVFCCPSLYAAPASGVRVWKRLPVFCSNRQTTLLLYCCPVTTMSWDELSVGCCADWQSRPGAARVASPSSGPSRRW